MVISFISIITISLIDKKNKKEEMFHKLVKKSHLGRTSLFFLDIDNPKPDEIKKWMEVNNLTIISASYRLGISKRQFSRFLSGDTNAKKVHSLAMQMIWLILENKKMEQNNLEKKENSKKRKIRIPIK